MHHASIILALASAPGWSERALIRASGAGSLELLDRRLERPLSRTRAARAVRLLLGPDQGLPCLACVYESPRSYTGEDGFELIIPGSPLLASRVVNSLIGASEANARLATPGEFSARAYMNGRLDLDQAEGVSALIAARSRAQADAARRLLEGARGQEFRAWYEEVVSLLALVEAGIDFTDQEDVVPITADELRRRLGVLESSMTSALGGAGVRPATAAPVVALVGPPNAGKSTLFNALLGRKRSVASAVAGTTRDVLREQLDLNGDVPGAGSVELLDLPGLETTPIDGSPSAAAAQQAARRALAEADVILHCDPSGVFVPVERNPAATVIRVQTKADLAAFQPAAPSERVMAVCSLDGWHIGPLRRAIADTATGPSDAVERANLIPRHHRAVAGAVVAISTAIQLCTDGSALDPAVVAQSLREAADHLGDLAGRISPDDVLGRIFATFCIGK
ncbi:MAG: 50S ribosome-binding GTPase [Phycisphaerales bacterium]|nr:50S ribosome-binding GTPase [Phycisphaerales bacterium]